MRSTPTAPTPQPPPDGPLRPELADAFRTQAAYCAENGSPLYARICGLLAEYDAVDDLVVDARWDVPLRLLGGLHYLALRDGLDPWADPRALIDEEGNFLARFIAQQQVQTNEVQRCWGLLPAFLSLGDRPLDVVELGPSAGLNLLWDRYSYRYAAGRWGPDGAVLGLAGRERSPVPAELLERHPTVVRRRGIDLEPVDVTTEAGARLLESFVWADQAERLERLRRAIGVARATPPELLRGDYVDLLPDALHDRRAGALAVVFQTASTAYLSTEDYERLRRTLDQAERPLAWISTRRHYELEANRGDGYELELALWPDVERPRLVAHMGFHGHWLEWLG